MMDAGQRERFEALVTGNTRGVIQATLLAWTVCDETGRPLFSDADIQELAKLPARPVNHVFDAALKQNRLTKEDVEELEKNSEAAL
jgi:hypothetical protein